jgi:hypothetical protein
MKKKLILTAIPAMLLVLGLVLAGCPTGGGGDGSGDGGGGGGGGGVEKSLLITGIEQSQIPTDPDPLVQVELYPAGTSVDDARAQVGRVAVAGYTTISISDPPAPYTATAQLYETTGYNRWKGSGNYDVYFLFGSNRYRKTNVSFTGASTPIAATTFKDITLGSANTLNITGITQDQVDAFGSTAPRVGIFTAGTSAADAANMIGFVAGGDGSDGDFYLSSGGAPYTATAFLYNAGGNRWNGTGTYDIFFQFGTNNLTMTNVTFSGTGSTLVAATSFTPVP